MHAGFRDGRGEAAVVADHFVLALVMGERDGAVLAFEFLAAGAAENDGGISAAVEQDHDLLFAVEALFDFGSEFARDDLLLAGFLEFLAHVDDFDFGQRALLDTIGEFDERVFVLLRVEIRLQRRRGRAHHDDGVRHLRAHDGDVAGVVARSFFLLVGRVVLFVDDDQREIGDRGEDRRPRADDHARFAALDAVPLLGALAIGERGVQDGNFVAENLVQVGGDGGSQADFRDEQDGGASGFEHAAHGGQIDRGLARSGDAVQQHAGELARRRRLAASARARIAARDSVRSRISAGRGFERETEKSRGLFENLDQATANQRGERGSRDLQRLQVVTGTLPPEAASVSISIRWLSFSLPSADFSIAIFIVRVASRAAETSSRCKPFLADHSSEDGFRDAGGGAEGFFADELRVFRASIRIPRGNRELGILLLALRECAANGRTIRTCLRDAAPFGLAP